MRHARPIRGHQKREVHRGVNLGVPAENAVGWHVILGDNGSGKSSFLRAIAVTLVGPDDVGGLRQSGEDWLRRGESQGSIGVVFAGDDTFDRLGEPGRQSNKYTSLVQIGGRYKAYPPTQVFLNVSPSQPVRGVLPEPSVWSPSATGWFAAGFGPFRRFTGGDADAKRLAEKQPRLARFLSLFDERFALSDALDWLVELKFMAVSGKDDGLFERVKAFVNQPGFLPFGVRLADVEPPKRVLFLDGAGARVPIEELSDGFRSILSLTLELLRHLTIAFDPESVFDPSGTMVLPPGVVLIDEVDVHLHPTWQKSVGTWLTEAFPNVQFIVTTHSPLACRGAAKGSIFVLPPHGQRGPGRALEGAEKDRLIFGNVLDAYGTGAFGTGVEQSDAGRTKLERLAELNAKEFEADLLPEEQTEREELRRVLPSRAATVDGAK